MRIPQLSLQNTPLNQGQVDGWNQLVVTLSPEQAAWLLGFVAAANSFQSGTIPNTATSMEANASFTVLYASQTGNAGKLAKKLVAAATEAGLSASAINVADFKTSKLKSITDLVLIASTQGQGDPPDSATEFHRFLTSPRAPKLPQLRYSVLALGDSSYVNFCKVGSDWDKRLTELGGTAFVPRMDCDVEFDAMAAEWITKVIADLKARLPQQAAGVAPVHLSPVSADLVESSYDKKNPFHSQVLERINLNGRGSEKHTIHIELSLTGSGIQYQPGDALGIVPRNDPSYVDEFLAAMQISPEQIVSVDGEDQPLKTALVERFEVTTITRPFVKAYATATGNVELTELASPAKAAEFQAFVHGREIIDLLQAHPPNGIPPQDFLPMLRRLQPRLYSIASSLYAHEEEVHLTVGVTKYESHGRKRHGVCSTYLGERLIEAEPVRVYPAPNPAFKLPQDPATPIIMIGPGTGVAPFRAFVEEREALGATGKNWLFFGDQHFATDFLYQAEWQRYLKSGVLACMDVAFSRDQPNKIYVQHRMAERSRDLYAWLQDGAVVYICGDATHMAADVNEALLAMLMKEGNQTREAADEYLHNLHRDKRYQRDVY